MFWQLEIGQTALTKRGKKDFGETLKDAIAVLLLELGLSRVNLQPANRSYS
jgi:hypothetical protein